LKWEPLWLLGCIGLSAGVNHVMRPQVDYALSPSERTMTTGTLTLEEEGRVHRFQLATIHVVSADVPRLLADPIRVRSLLLRSPEQDGQPPDVELLFDLAAGAPRPIEPNARDITLLRARSLGSIPSAVGAELRSRVRLPGSDAAAEVASGSLVIDEALELRKGDPAQGWRIRGELALTADGERPRRITGKVDARLVW
jgi:hypothetical protein